MTESKMQQPKTCGVEPYDQLASAIVTSFREKGACAPEDLRAKGFRTDDVSRYWALAYALARVELGFADA